MINGQRALAAALGVSVSTVNKYLHDPQWKKFGLSKNGPWSAGDLVKAREFIAKFFPRPEEAAAPPFHIDEISELRGLSPIQRAKLQDTLEKIASRKVDRELKLGLYIKREEVERGIVERVQIVRRELSNIRLLAIKLPVTDVQKAESILENWAKRVCERFERGEY